MANPISRAFKGAGTKVTNDSGSAAVEFVLVVPFLFVVFWSIAYAFDLVMLRNKMAATADAIAAAAAMDSNITDDEMAAIFKAGAALLEPAASGAVLKLTSVVPSGTKRVVAWSDAVGGSADKAGATFTFPTGVAASFGAEDDKSVLVATVTVSYTSAAAKVLGALSSAVKFPTSKHSFSEQSFALPIGVGDRRWIGRS
ncbi:TadE/TadG family type IV pilus assembly protein [Xanthobacter sp. V13C-7B]|uniref:TadE/TadG family type IV pilus assembly protein n=1 Tax=Xanthobacter variabilis TaxID=3119932 RepID=UPI003727C783